MEKPLNISVMNFRIKDLMVSVLPNLNDCSINDCPAGCSESRTDTCTANTGSKNCDFDFDKRKWIEIYELKAMLQYSLAKLSAIEEESKMQPSSIEEIDLLERKLKEATAELEIQRKNLNNKQAF